MSPMFSKRKKALASAGVQPLVVDSVDAFACTWRFEHLHVVHRVRRS